MNELERKIDDYKETLKQMRDNREPMDITDFLKENGLDMSSLNEKIGELKRGDWFMVEGKDGEKFRMEVIRTFEDNEELRKNYEGSGIHHAVLSPNQEGMLSITKSIKDKYPSIPKCAELGHVTFNL